MNSFPKQKQTHRPKGGMVGGGIVREFRTDMYTLLYLKWLANKDLLYSTGNTAQYSVVAYMGKESKRVDICICITDSLCCTAETNTL